VHRAVLQGGEDQGADLAPSDECAAASPAEEIGEVEVLVTDPLAQVSPQLLAKLSADIEVIVATAVMGAVARSGVFEHLW